MLFRWIQNPLIAEQIQTGKKVKETVFFSLSRWTKKKVCRKAYDVIKGGWCHQQNNLIFVSKETLEGENFFYFLLFCCFFETEFNVHQQQQQQPFHLQVWMSGKEEEAKGEGRVCKQEIYPVLPPGINNQSGGPWTLHSRSLQIYIQQQEFKECGFFFFAFQSNLKYTKCISF